MVGDVLDGSQQRHIHLIVLALPEGLAFKMHKSVLASSSQDPNNFVGDLLVNAEKLPEEDEGVAVGEAEALSGDALAEGDHLRNTGSRTRQRHHVKYQEPEIHRYGENFTHVCISALPPH